MNEGSPLTASLRRWCSLYSFGSRPFTFSGYEDLYADDSLTAFDNFAPKDTFLAGKDAYEALWEPLINERFSDQVIVRFDVVRTGHAGDLAWSAVSFWFDAKENGEPFSSSQHATHVWRLIDGKWRIVHEHIMGPILVDGSQIKP